MALASYISQTQSLLHDTAGTLYSTASLTTYINQARGQIAAEGMCIRSVLTLSTVASQQSYLLSTISVASVTGAQYVLVVRKAAHAVGAANPARLDGRPWDYFFNYCLTKPTTATPTTWSQLSQGQGGQFYLYPTPVAGGTLTLDCVLIPVDLVDDTTVELIPWPWTTAVCYYAAYLAYMNAQRNADADRMWQLYQQKMQRARDMTTPSTLPRNFPLSNQVSGVPTVTPGPFPGAQGGS